MRPIFILAIFGTLLLLPVVGSAETNAECQMQCSAEKASRDESCPLAADDGDQARAQCLQESQDGYNACVAECAPPEPADAPPAEKTE
jgi:hypothetical protein